ncbi:MAG TPA: SRPBCC family protein [Acidimicrobiales bacterium]|nr:SRPBCC family protein [Acidimicrobiales bacterium]
MHDSVTVHMAASPERVWELVSDVTRIGRYSPETFEAEWIDGATGPAVGAKFRGHVKRNEKGPVYWTTCTVSDCEPGKTFAFGVGNKPDAPLNVWRYDIVAAGDGCDVTESFTLAPTWALKLYWTCLGWARGKTNRNGMRRTLERVRDDAEASSSSG